MPQENPPAQKPERLIEKAFMAAKLAQMSAEPCDATWRWSNGGPVHDTHEVSVEGWARASDAARQLGLDERKVCGILYANRNLLGEYMKPNSLRSVYWVPAVKAVVELASYGTGLHGKARAKVWNGLKPPLPV